MLRNLIEWWTASPEKIGMAVRRQDFDTIKKMISAGVNFNTDYLDFTPLGYAAASGDYKMTKLLLKAGAQVELMTKDCSMTPLLLAADFCHQEVRDPSQFQNTKVIRLLLEEHCNKNIQYCNDSSDSTGATALIFAVQRGNIETVKVLLDYLVDINIQDKYGYTALFYAVKKSDATTLTLLLKDEKADKNVNDYQSKTIFDHAREINHPGIMNALGLNPKKEIKNIYAEKLQDLGVEATAKLCCPISKELLFDPVTLSSGITYSRQSLMDYFSSKSNPPSLPCPVTRKRISISELTLGTNVLIKEMVEEFVADKLADKEKQAKEVAEKEKMIASRLSYFGTQTTQSKNSAVSIKVEQLNKISQFRQ